MLCSGITYCYGPWFTHLEKLHSSNYRKVWPCDILISLAAKIIVIITIIVEWEGWFVYVPNVFSIFGDATYSIWTLCVGVSLTLGFLVSNIYLSCIYPGLWFLWHYSSLSFLIFIEAFRGSCFHTYLSQLYIYVPTWQHGKVTVLILPPLS